ncbi:unnamed protein product [Caenorhabditis auriculariae]|uniref:Phorbol-ester/DAG-type domain-containing protein n=1 Tax=Caenorhabditis auriculariae TaxID=2777116 RepID=A0A8S1HJX7_9PELO|nr:unnamed protein product [Caenorhabditis auriculariae]
MPCEEASPCFNVEERREILRHLAEVEYRISVADKFVFNLLDELERVRQLWASSEQTKNEAIQVFEGQKRTFEQKCRRLEVDMELTAEEVQQLRKDKSVLMRKFQTYEEWQHLFESVMFKYNVWDYLTGDERSQFHHLKHELDERSLKTDTKVADPQVLDSTNEDSETDETIVTIPRSPSPVRRRGRRSVSVHARLASRRRSRSRPASVITVEEIDPEFSPPKRPRTDLKKEVLSRNSRHTTAVDSEDLRVILRKDSSEITAKRTVRKSMSLDSVPVVKPMTPFRLNPENDLRILRQPAVWCRDVENVAPFRLHRFQPQNFQLKMQKCDECQMIVLPMSNGSRCVDCHQVVHRKCERKLYTPCVPRKKDIPNTRRTRNAIVKSLKLQNYCTDAQPMIPFLVIHVVVAIEKKGLHIENLYLAPGQMNATLCVLDELLTSVKVPRLDLRDPEILTEVLKAFLDGLQDPLVPRTSREEFIAAADLFFRDEQEGVVQLDKAICELPPPNRDTLSYLFVHWKKLSEASERREEILARCLAQHVMGRSTTLRTGRTLERDRVCCEKVLQALFNFDLSYWRQFLLLETNSTGSKRLPPRNELRVKTTTGGEQRTWRRIISLMRLRLVSLVFFLALQPTSDVVAVDVFCGELSVFEEQRFGRGAVTLSSQTTSDLKQCLDICCSIPNCEGVTFEGILIEGEDSNCLLVGCNSVCTLNEPRRFADGVVSVLVARKKEASSNKTAVLTDLSSNSTRPSLIGEVVLRSRLTPIWVLAIAISVAVVCVGLNVALFLAYCCYCRRKRRSQKAHISTPKAGPTLHAYNPSV